MRRSAALLAFCLGLCLAWAGALSLTTPRAHPNPRTLTLYPGP